MAVSAPADSSAVRRFLPLVLLGLTGLGFLASAIPKVLGDPTMVEGFAKFGVPRAGLAVLGLLEFAGAVGLMLRRTRVAAAVGLTSILFGAIATHIAMGMALVTVTFPVALIVLMAVALALDPAVRFETVSTAGQSKARRYATYALSGVLALQFLLAGGMKAFGAPEMMANLGRLHFGEVFIHLLGVLELLGAVGLLVNAFRTRAALGLLAIMHGAVAVHMVEGFMPKGFLALGVLVLLWVVVALDGRLKVHPTLLSSS